MNNMPAQPPKPPEWVSYVPRRSAGGKWKFHTGVGHAKNALITGLGGQIYKWNGTEYELIWEVPTGERYYWYKANNMPWAGHGR